MRTKKQKTETAQPMTQPARAGASADQPKNSALPARAGASDQPTTSALPAAQTAPEAQPQQ